MDLPCEVYLLVGLLICLALQSWAQEREYTVREELPENVRIGNLRKDLDLALDPDVKLSSPLQFKPVYKTGDVPLVRVEASSGDIFTTSNRIDREKLCSGVFTEKRCFYEIEVAVLPDEIFRLVKIRFQIEDINDNAPLFQSTVINISIPENTAINSRYPVPSALDPDVGINGIQHYELVKSVTEFGLDIIETPEGDKWPQLIVQQSLDREQKDTFVMKIKVEDGGTPPKSSTAILQVTISDVNDNQPVFKENDVEVHVPENAPVGTSVTQLHATDADLGSNAQIHFSFSNQISPATKQLFTIDSTTGLITIRQQLDREVTPVHKLIVLASDGSSTPSRATVTVNVTDINDNVPSIDTRYIMNPVNGTVLLSENAPLNTKIALITVTDRDADLNGKVTCYTDHDVPFRLKPVFDNQFLLETAAPLDYETTREYAIRIVASDSGKPPLNTSAMVLIKIKDENDNSPIFPQPEIQLSIPENNDPSTQLIKISATDADSGRNAEISYTLGPNPPEAFNIDRRSGILSVGKRLDREKQDKYSFTVVVRDSGLPPLQNNVTVKVIVQDVNDNSPAFTHPEYNFYVPENLPLHGTVGLITVTDADAGDNAVVTLSILNGKDNFIIDPKTGVIKPNITFDREQQSSYSFVVKAVDGGRPQCVSFAKVTINVVDVNDNRPVFVIPSSNYSYDLVQSTTSPGSVVTRVFAIDNDTGMNAELQYSIIGGSPKGLFAIDKTTGNITLQEKIVPADQGLHRLVVKVKDLGQPESLYAISLVHLFVNETVSNATFIQEQLRKSLETPLDRNVGDNEVTPHANSYIIVVIAIIAGTMTVILVIFVTALVRCRQTPRHKVVQKAKQSGEWVSPNQENRQTKKKKKKKKRSPKSLLLNFVTIEESKPDDPSHEHINGTLDLPVELEEQTMGKYNWATTPTTFKPDSPDLAKHYKSASPQPTFQIKPETPVAPKKHHVIQDLPLDNTFVVGCDSLSKCSSNSSDPYSVSECSCQGSFKNPGQIHTRQNRGQHPDASFPSIQPTCPHKTQRRVTFHLPDGSQESCSDSGLGDQELTSCTSTTQPLPLGFPQEEFYEQTSPNSRTEGDGNSDPESTIEVNLQRAMAEASETCTQECLILGHSDSCWMPPALTQFQPSHNATLPNFSFQQGWSCGTKSDGCHTLGRSMPKDELDKGSNRPQFYNTIERHCSNKEDPVKVIPLANFTPSAQQSPATGGTSAFIHEHQL
ncbi:protocadherin-11 X-linked isoform X1 [Paramormyrops kingsleyae]|uniref:Protocadherin 11 Y-linked n=1 Tax=Paramormyrops kingsleyae TaxID=1676925 RepID=A0A3B3QUY6_9TELE|nr:protocadherin-11 X-linked-like isoform X1 [Paramormyrops kingsleyae]XP_023650774.1 protocadherin-11 X-linked-like isoform X1 [Paramormyrops kingsleyae]XP_023650784.1 protocadherin-11 X-linked-like isoform X1 [Paramormyrops kingsleyae]